MYEVRGIMGRAEKRRSYRKSRLGVFAVLPSGQNSPGLFTAFEILGLNLAASASDVEAV